MTTLSVLLEGVGLRSGKPARVSLALRPGPMALDVAGVETPLAALCVADAERATVVRTPEGATVATVEHLFAACAALGAHEGVVVRVEGGEVPLLDGGASSFARALASLGLHPVSPPLVVRRDETLAHGESRYTFRVADGVSVAVALSFDDARVEPHAGWDGTRGDFVLRIAPARTFAFAREVEALIARGQASHVDPTSVVVLTPDAILSAGAPFEADEPARHKLLDLVGDLFLYGGPPRGAVEAVRPGHAATHAILRQALDTGVVARSL